MRIRHRRKPAPVAAAAKPKLWSGHVARGAHRQGNTRRAHLPPRLARRPAVSRSSICPASTSVFRLQIDGKRVNRTYTIASSPSRPDYCEITVKREENGLASRHLHDTLREGDLLNVSAPAGVSPSTARSPTASCSSPEAWASRR